MDFSKYFKYDESSPSGLVWKVSRGKAKVGDSCGNIKGNGYYQVGLLGKNYPCHRIIWFLFNGPIEKGWVIDHMDNNPLNNKISNLRISTVQGNTHNRKKRSGLTSSYKGVCWNKRANKWKVSITFNYKQIHLGFFSDELEAKAAYEKASLEMFGDFSWRGDGKTTLAS